MPPPISRTSTSSWTTSGLSNVPAIVSFLCSEFLLADQLGRIAGAEATHHLAGEGAALVDVGQLRHGLAAERIDRAFGRRADRELEALHHAVAELDGPHDGVRTAQRLHRTAQRHDVGVVTRFDGALRADLDAGIALPAL